MNPTYITLVLKNVEDVLSSPASQLSEADTEKLKESKAILERGIADIPETGLTEQEKSAIMQGLIILMEVLKCVADHYK